MKWARGKLAPLRNALEAPSLPFNLCVEYLLGEQGSWSRKLLWGLWGIYVCCFGVTTEGRSGSWPGCVLRLWGRRGSLCGPCLPGLVFWLGQCRRVPWQLGWQTMQTEAEWSSVAVPMSGAGAGLMGRQGFLK